MFFSVTQTNAAANKKQDEAREILKPLARYIDDEDLEKMLKERKRDGDPMFMFMKNTKKKKKEKTSKGLLLHWNLGLSLKRAPARRWSSYVAIVVGGLYVSASSNWILVDVTSTILIYCPQAIF